MDPWSFTLELIKTLLTWPSAALIIFLVLVVFFRKKRGRRSIQEIQPSGPGPPAEPRTIYVVYAPTYIIENVTVMPPHDAHPLLSQITHWTFISGIVMILAGIVIVYLGATGETEFSFFGQTFKSTNVGIGAIFIGGALIVLNVRRVLKTYERKSP